HRRSAWILILGHSFVYWVARHTEWSSWGKDLSSSDQASIIWQGRKGIRWSGVLLSAWHAAQELLPDMLLIHARGNDLGKLSSKAPSKCIMHDLGIWWEWFPNTHVIWPTMIPRRSWGMGCNPHKLNQACRGVNREVSHELLKVGGSLGTRTSALVTWTYIGAMQCTYPARALNCF
ncbi:hypothetical protein JRQ81_001112, partial [Phrynocephalus forsythii]